jgi:fermentation-respiration switch protein FrsA (DUF1100 family)
MQILVSIVIFLLAAYVLMAGFLFFQQDRLLFLPHVPGRSLTQEPLDAGLHYESVQIETLDGVHIHGWFVPARGSERVILFFHGNAGNISQRLDSLALFNRLGLSTLIVDYRGYGRSEGQPSEKGTYYDADAAWRHLVEDRGIEPSHIVVFGRSLGAAVAAWLAARTDPGALIVESGFSSIPDLAADLYPVFPVRLLSRFRYAAAKQLAQVRAPVLVVHSRDDELIPFAHGRVLYRAANPPKSFLELQGGHNDGIWVSGARYEAGLRQFLSGLEKTTREGIPTRATNADARWDDRGSDQPSALTSSADPLHAGRR